MTDEFSFLIRVQFLERDLNLIGFYIVLISQEKTAVYKCATVVNYHSDGFTRKFSLASPWVRFLQQVSEEYADLSTRELKEFSDKIRTYYQSGSPEYLAKMLKIALEINDQNVQKVMMDELIKEDLQTIFPAGNLVVEFAWETLGQGESTAGNDIPEVPDKLPEPPAPDTVEVDYAHTISVEPDIDPNNGVPVGQLSIDDEIGVIIDRTRHEKTMGKIVSLLSPHPGSSNLVIKVELPDGLWGNMMVSKSMMVRSGASRAPRFWSKLPPELLFNTILVLAALIIVLFIFYLGLIFTG